MLLTIHPLLAPMLKKELELYRRLSILPAQAWWLPLSLRLLDYYIQIRQSIELHTTGSVDNTWAGKADYPGFLKPKGGSRYVPYPENVQYLKYIYQLPPCTKIVTSSGGGGSSSSSSSSSSSDDDNNNNNNNKDETLALKYCHLLPISTFLLTAKSCLCFSCSG